MSKRFLIILAALLVFPCVYVVASTNSADISNNYFSFTMPGTVEDLYAIEKEGVGIYVVEKTSMKLGMGGLAFGFKLYKSPQDYMDIPNVKKLGELTSKKGMVYDVVLVRPTEIQYGEGEEIQKNYNRLYDIAETIEIKGINGNKYVKNQGMKGKDIYKDVIKKYIKAINENWDSEKYAQNTMGYIYSELSQVNKDLIDKIGYAYYDINSDGIEELFIGGTIKGKTLVFDVYTMVNRKPKHVISGGDVDKYFICYDSSMLCNEYTPDKYGLSVFVLEKNSDELNRIATFIYDEEKKNPWFAAYGNTGNLDNVSKKEYKKNKKFYQDYKKIDYTPLSEFK